MAENETSLDSFLTPTASEPQQTNVAETVNLEEEFAKLLNDFIGHEKASETKEPEANSTELDSFIAPAENQASVPNIGSLDSFVTAQPAPTPEGLDGFVTPQSTPETSGLDSFVTPQSSPTSEGLDGFVTPQSAPAAGGLDSFVTPPATANGQLDELAKVTPQTTNTSTTSQNTLKAEEQELARAVSNFQDGLYSLADRKNLKLPTTDYNEEQLKPNYKPSVGKKIAQYMLDGWDLISKADPENMKRLSKNANDEEYLAFAETLKDTDMQLAIISYVEILINLEICEVKYEQKREQIQKNRIKKELYEEYMELQERKALFIKKLKEKNFPIDVDRLINNYFRVAQKDPDGSFDALTKNPAMFAPIQVEKIKPKFFGLIKVTPEDGIKENQKIGKFIKNLKV